MPSTSIICGVLLILVGIIGYIYGLLNGTASMTALIPAIFGLIIAVLGFFALTKENLRKHIMHFSMLVGLLGFLIPAIRLALKGSSLVLNAALIFQLLMALICLAFVVLGVKSFIDARRSRAV